MNRVQFGLLLLLGVILLGGAAFWIFDRTPDASLTSSKAALDGSPVQIAEIARRRPNMLIFTGTAPANTALTLRLSGNKIGNTTTDAKGAFQLTTSPLPRDEDLFFTLDYGSADTLGLFLIDRRPQLIALMKAGDHYMPLQRPASGEGILLIDRGDNNMLHIVGQAKAGASAFLYANGQLIGKAEAAGEGTAIRLFDIAVKADAAKGDLRLDIYSAAGQLTARSALNTGDSKAWQTIAEPKAQDSFYVWRDLAAQQMDPEQIYPGQFIPAATNTTLAQ